MQSIVIIDDSAVVRYVVSDVIHSLDLNDNDIDLRTYTAEDGVEGLGYVFVVKPTLIIVDTTLPKYSGLEVVDYLVSNSQILQNTIPILLWEEGVTLPGNLTSNFIAIDKRSRDFLPNLLKSLNLVLKAETVALDSQGFRQKSLIQLGTKVLKWANRADLLAKTAFNSKFLVRPLAWALWLGTEIIMSMWLAFFSLFASSPRALEENIVLVSADRAKFRARIYPTFAGIIAMLLGALLLAFVYLSGGYLLFSVVK